jgi:hypothetical protein
MFARFKTFPFISAAVLILLSAAMGTLSVQALETDAWYVPTFFAVLTAFFVQALVRGLWVWRRKNPRPEVHRVLPL